MGITKGHKQKTDIKKGTNIMSKTTKIIAALGVVAGLGVAALPAFTYAESTSGNVDVYVDVRDAIAMTIVGNNDNGANAPKTGVTYHSVDNSAPSGLTEVDGHTAGTTAGVSSSYVSLLPNAVANDTTDPTFKSTITVYTNSSHGYTLGVLSSTTDAALLNDDGTNSIPAGSSLTAGTAAWAYKINPTAGETGDTTGTADITANTWTAMATTNTQIAHEDTATNDGTEYVVNYGVATNDDQATGIYRTSLVYTAATKNS